jgi:hypothetical protein
MQIRIFDAQIPVAVKAAEAAKEGKSVFSYPCSFFFIQDNKRVN